MCYLVLKEQFLQDLVAIEKRSHLVPSRTQKLSSLSADIAKSCLVKYARRQLETHCNGEFFIFCDINIKPNKNIRRQYKKFKYLGFLVCLLPHRFGMYSFVLESYNKLYFQDLQTVF